MKSITLYIILGALVFTVIIFLFATSLVDYKKRKKMEIQKKADDEQKKVSGIKIAIILNHIIKKNEALLKNFVPSVGKFKMSQLKVKAVDSLLILKKSNLFNFFELSHFDELMIIFNKLKNNNSNIWKKRFGYEIEKIKNLIKSDKSIKITDAEIQKIIRKINRVYKNDITK